MPLFMDNLLTNAVARGGLECAQGGVMAVRCGLASLRLPSFFQYLPSLLEPGVVLLAL